MKYEKGHIPWCDGKTKEIDERLKQHSERMSGENNSFFGKKHSPETIEKIRLARLGKKLSTEHKNKIKAKSLFVTNNPGAERKGKRIKDIFGEQKAKEWADKLSNDNHPKWKGDDAGYNSIHLYIRRHFPEPLLCERCHERKPYDLANITGNYTRDRKDYQYLCRLCHRKQEKESGIIGKGKALYCKRMNHQ